MTSTKAYFNFNGNCRRAFEFYQSCLGGKLDLQTIGESPTADRMPESMKNMIMHGTLTTEGFQIMGSDMSARPHVHGTAISVMLDFDSEAEIRSTYDKLAAGGVASHPIESTFWGALFGGLTDQFGNPWLLHYLKK
jgi:PhnB protein